MKDSASGAECCEGHFHCGACLADLCESFVNVDNRGVLIEREGRLMCAKYPLECSSGFADQDLAQHLPVDAFHEYLRSREERARAQIEAEAHDEMRVELQAEIQQLAALDERWKVCWQLVRTSSTTSSRCLALAASKHSPISTAGSLLRARLVHVASVRGVSPTVGMKTALACT